MYELTYNLITGKVSGIKRLSDNTHIPICEGNSDYWKFIKWNSEQEVPLDLNSTIEPVRNTIGEYEALMAIRGKQFMERIAEELNIKL